eukprot:SAG31_NODE_24741_length_475_cov_0.688830_1_plen_27_part_10
MLPALAAHLRCNGARGSTPHSYIKVEK